jgi:hypothetical protein
MGGPFVWNSVTWDRYGLMCSLFTFVTGIAPRHLSCIASCLRVIPICSRRSQVTWYLAAQKPHPICVMSGPAKPSNSPC